MEEGKEEMVQKKDWSKFCDSMGSQKGEFWDSGKDGMRRMGSLWSDNERGDRAAT